MTVELRDLPKSTQCHGCAREVRLLVNLFIEYPGQPMITYVLCVRCIDRVRSAIDRL